MADRKRRGAADEPASVVEQITDVVSDVAHRVARKPRGADCPHCGAELTPHADGERTHCNTCGCCFDVETMEPRPGHPLCTEAARASA